MNNKSLSREIRRRSDHILQDKLEDVLRERNIYINFADLNTQDDDGEDFLATLGPRSNGGNIDTFKFFIQNKGTESFEKKIITQKSNPNYNKISFQFKQRNINRYLRSHDPIVLTIVDIKALKVYWHFVQIDENLCNTSDKDTIQVYIPIENQLTSETADIFLDELVYAKRNQFKKYWNNLLYKPNARLAIAPNSFNFKDEHILDSLFKVINQFEGLQVLPQYLIVKLYPFSVNGPTPATYNTFTLSTNNIKLFNFLESISYDINSGYSSTDSLIEDVIDYQAKMQTVVAFLINNLIYTIDCFQSRQRIDIFKLRLLHKCNCERCCYNRLDINSAVDVLKCTDSENEDDVVLFRKAFSYYKLGDFKASAMLYKGLFERFKAKKEFINQFICIYNIVKLNSLIKSTHFGHELNELRNYTNAFLEEQLIDFKTTVSDETYQIMVWLKNGDFLDDIIWDTNTTIRSIHRQYFNDQYGGYSSNQYPNKLINNISFLSNFLKSNLIIFDSFLEFEEIVTSTIDALFASYSINNTKSSRIDSFDSYLIDLMLFHIENDNLISIFHKYDIKEVKYITENDDNNSPFCDKFLNFLNSLDTITELINRDQNNYYFFQKIERLINNLIVIASRLQLSKTELTQINSALIKAFSENKVNSHVLKSLQHFFNRKAEQLEISSLEAWLKIIMQLQNHWYQEDVLQSFPQYLKRIEPTYKIKDAAIIQELFATTALNDKDRIKHITNSMAYYAILTNKEKENVRLAVKQELDSCFHKDLYSCAVLYDIIDYKAYYNDYLQIIPPMSNFKPSSFNGYEVRNYTLEEFINIAYKVGIDLTSPELQHLHGNIPYYTWLMNLKRFDYEEFNPYWILRNQTIYYTRAFKTVTKLKTALKKSIKNKPIAGIVRAYFDIYN